jgi:hypothetical protein
VRNIKLEYGFRHQRRARCQADVVQAHAGQEVGGQCDEPRLEAGVTPVEAPPSIEPEGDPRARFPEGRALHETGQQQISLLEQPAVLAIEPSGRQEPGGLQLEQGRCNDQEARRRLEVEVVQGFDGFEVLLRDAGQGDVVDVHPLPGDEMEKEVDRPLEHLQPHFVSHDFSTS